MSFISIKDATFLGEFEQGSQGSLELLNYQTCMWALNVCGQTWEQGRLLSQSQSCHIQALL